MTRALGTQIEEIKADPALQYYGAAIALVGSLTAVFWLTAQPIDRILDPDLTPICWPLFQRCFKWRVLDPVLIRAMVFGLLILGIGNALLFLRPRTITWAFWTLALGTAFRATILAQDYRLVLNQHYMALWISAVYLFVPGKRRSLTYLVVCFYVWAASLKFNQEWISGAALYGRRPLGLPAGLIPTACFYVICLELLIAPLILSRSAIIFWIAFAQLLVFHLSSFWVVGFFYPILMFLLLTIFPLSRSQTFLPGNGAGPDAAQLGRWSPRLLVIGFSVLQLVPRFFPGDVAITGEGRIWALNMFDAPLECRATLVRHTPGAADRPVRLRLPFVNPRIACDPIVYYEAAKTSAGSGLPGPRRVISTSDWTHAERATITSSPLCRFRTSAQEILPTRYGGTTIGSLCVERAER